MKMTRFKRYHAILFLVIVNLMPLTFFGQDEVDSVFDKSFVLRKVATLQSKDHPFYCDGLFRTYSYQKDSTKKRDDDIVFTSANVALSLQYSVKNGDWSKEEIEIFESIIKRITSNYWHYKSKNGEVTYNSWQSHPVQTPVPNSNYPSWVKNHMMPADDLDGTALVYSSMSKHSVLLDSVKTLMSKFTNRNNGMELKNVPKKYRKWEDVYVEFYSTRIRQHVDICSMSNMVLLSFKHDLPINKYDSATINLMKEMVLDRSYVKTPYLISNGYQLPATIFYHLTRAMEYGGKRYFGNIWEIVVEDLIVKFKNATTERNKMIYSLCLMRLGHYSKDIISANVITELSTARFGKTSALYASPYWLLKKYVQSDVLGGSSVCEGFNWSVLLEYLVLKENNQQK